MNNSKKPNIVVIMADQLRAGVTAREGFPLDTMPFLDSLATKNIWFDKAYSTCPMCMPARASMLTGRYPSAHRLCGHESQKELQRNDLIFSKDLFQVARENGYTTALIGKSHTYLTSQDADVLIDFSHHSQIDGEMSELDKKFDEYMENTLFFGVSEEPNPFPVECQLPYRITEKSIKWIDGLGDKPFMLWMSYPEPHHPFQVPEPYFDMFPPEKLPEANAAQISLESLGFKWKFIKELGKHVYPEYDRQIPRMRSNYYGLIRLVDDQLKRFMDYLGQKGLIENTLIVFLSDHGDFAGDYGLVRKGVELPDALIRIPLVFAGWNVKPNTGLSDCHVSITDIFPTLCEAIGADIPEGVQGRSLRPVITGQSFPEAEFESVYAETGTAGLYFTEEDNISIDDWRLIWTNKAGIATYDDLNMYSSSGTMRMVRKGDWKFIFDMMGNGKLFNLKEDPAEINNLYYCPGYENKVREMQGVLLQWMLRTHDPLCFPINCDRYFRKRYPHNYLYKT